MKFGMMYEIQIPEPHTPNIVQDTYKQVIAQVMLAEEVGFEYFWTVEHHFLTEFSYCPAPEVLYGAISQRTKTIRIGHAVALLPPQYNHPVRVAERAAVLDLLSDGRVELGTGRSTTLIEMEGFGIDPEETKPMWEEAISIIPRMWLEDPFSHEGRYFKIPPRSVIPKPVQKPHPPLWVACAQPASFTAAGQKGIGALCFHIGQPEELARRVQLYREGIEQAEPVGAFVNDQVAALGIVHCAESDKTGPRRGGARLANGSSIKPSNSTGPGRNRGRKCLIRTSLQWRQSGESDRGSRWANSLKAGCFAWAIRTVVFGRSRNMKQPGLIRCCALCSSVVFHTKTLWIQSACLGNM